MTMTQAPEAAKAAPGGRPRPKRRFDVLPYLLVSPVTLFIIALALVPAAFTIIQAFFRVDALDPPTRFDGFGNFTRLFKNDAIVGSIGNTGLYVVIGVTLSTLLGIGMAVLLQRAFRGRSIVIAVLILPWALPGVVEGILWTGIFDPNSGLIASVMRTFGADEGAVLLGQNKFLTIVLIELVQVWQITPLSALLILASLQLIPDELYEAAVIDGASTWRSFWHLTLPMARPGIAVSMVQAVIATLNVFDQPFVLNGAATTGASVTMQTYYVSFQNLDFGQGYALSLLITITTLVISLGVVRAVYRRVEL
ncbi:carbohydrate ABC transporter permease [Cryptosporangium arvum]|uniref:Carbohydrate ABC transporter membrane protein 1, CUT1 family n=1 Tax=Cryptosporangium arvum DSM 44712 TaxID=927661 RepID=A0A010ZWD0_9ACTN|nr:sugar ABC transporter permease [Cryptosporangium arvum]EXG82974.1 carbohydrate ABC transporter membrane protein 1, CUT1 family [Cryptosporangium arvum DSM 44712]